MKLIHLNQSKPGIFSFYSVYSFDSSSSAACVDNIPLYDSLLSSANFFSSSYCIEYLALSEYCARFLCSSKFFSSICASSLFFFMRYSVLSLSTNAFSVASFNQVTFFLYHSYNMSHYSAVRRRLYSFICDLLGALAL